MDDVEPMKQFRVERPVLDPVKQETDDVVMRRGSSLTDLDRRLSSSFIIASCSTSLNM